MTPTDEQLTITNFTRSSGANFVINALAGTGKTTTLEMVQNASKTQPILYLAFNKRIAEEATEKFADTTTVRTLNSLGHRVWMKAQSHKLTLDPKKTPTLLRGIIDETPRNSKAAIWEVFWPVVEGVSMAKALGYIPEGKFTHVKPLSSRSQLHAALEEEPDEFTQDLIDAVLTLSIRTAYEGFIDYNDQLYMPTLFGGTFPRFPFVFADEVQDFSPLNHHMLAKLVTGRLAAVGDPYQSIYAFRGAKTRGMEELTKKFNATPLSLSVSFRCPQAVVEAARWRVPHFRWTKPGGHVEGLDRLLLSDIPDDSAIVCRNNAPLFRLGLQLLSNKRSVSIAGSEVGPKIVGIMKKLGEDSTPRASLISAIEDWRAERLEKNSTSANDIADCMKVFAGFGETLGQALAVADHLFKQKGSITLLTGHKAKGLEWDTVFHLDPWLLKDDDQDLNLRYVITTRAKDKLFEVDSKDIR